MTNKINLDNSYTRMQKDFYDSGTSDHLNHNANKHYWDTLLSDVTENPKKWVGKKVLDFGCGKGRNIRNLLKLCDNKWERADGVDISTGNIDYCKTNDFSSNKSKWFVNNGIDLSDLKNKEYDLVISTIVLQHIPVYEIRKSILKEIFRVTKKGGIFSFQIGGKAPDGRYRNNYFNNTYDAPSTNGNCDVFVENIDDLTKDLESIGFVNIKVKSLPSYDDNAHSEWHYIRCEKQT